VPPPCWAQFGRLNFFLPFHFHWNLLWSYPVEFVHRGSFSFNSSLAMASSVSRLPKSIRIPPSSLEQSSRHIFFFQGMKAELNFPPLLGTAVSRGFFRTPFFFFPKNPASSVGSLRGCLSPFSLAMPWLRIVQTCSLGPKQTIFVWPRPGPCFGFLLLSWDCQNTPRRTPSLPLPFPQQDF